MPLVMENIFKSCFKKFESVFVVIKHLFISQVNSYDF